MSQFKFACPVCGQHITADAGNSGAQIECPTCFHKIIVPQAPAADLPKFILTAAHADRHYPPHVEQGAPASTVTAPAGRHLRFVAATVVLALVALAAFLISRNFFRPETARQPSGAKPGLVLTPPPTPVRSNPNRVAVGPGWTQDLSGVTLPRVPAAGRIHGQDFVCQRAVLQGGILSLRQGDGESPELVLAVFLFARRGEELSGRTVEISTNQTRAPRVYLRRGAAQPPTTQAFTNRAVTFTNRYTLKLEFGQAAGGRMPGRIYVCLPDDLKSYVAGTFDAEIRSPPARRRTTPPPRVR